MKISPLRCQYLFPSLLVLATLAVYCRVLGHDFIFSWDDYYYVTGNADIQAISWDNVKAVFSGFYVGNYAPVQMISYMLDHAVWGMNPTGFLFTNLALHILIGLLVYRLFIRLHMNCYLAFIGAAVFLLHPVQVESVAWISQRKSLLAMLFFLVSWDFFRRYREGGGPAARWYLLSLTAFILAGLSKSIVVVLPLVLMLDDYCFSGGPMKRRLLDKIPFVAISGVIALIAMKSQQPDYLTWGAGVAGGMSGYHGGSPWATFLTMLPVLCRYIGLLVWPVDLSVLYYAEIYTGISPSVLLSGAVIITLTLIAWWIFRKNRQAGFWVLFSLTVFLPVSQIIPTVAIMNDRYLYFPMVGIGALFGMVAARLYDRFQTKSLLLPAAIIALLAALSFSRTGVWRDDVTLWRDAVAKSPQRAEAWQNLGLSLMAPPNSDNKAAIIAFERSMAVEPRDTTLYFLANAYKLSGEYRKAVSHYEMLLALSPDNVMGLNALGNTHRVLGEYDLAEECLNRANALQPEAMEVVMSLGRLYAARKEWDRARSSFLAVEEVWQDSESALELAYIESLVGRYDEAFLWLEKALQRGFADRKAIVDRKELEPLRSDARFAGLITRYLAKDGSQ